MRGSFASLLLLLTLGCSGTHEVDDGGADSDAGIVEDGGALDAGAPDAGRASSFTMCSPTLGEIGGEGCFCPGPAALFGRVLYRQSIGIEVWDLTDPIAPTLTRTVMERAASEGGLAVAQGHLLSVGNFEETLRIYALDDPLDPTLARSHPMPGVQASRIVATEDFAVVAGRIPTGFRLHGVDLGNIEAPTDAYDLPLEGDISSIAVDGDRLYLGTRVGPPFEPWLEVRSLRTGDLIGRHRMGDDTSGGYFSGLSIHRGRLVRAAPGAVEVLEVGAEPPVVIGRFETGMDQPIAVDVIGDLAVVGGSAMYVLSLEDPTAPRLLGRAEASFGDARAVLTDPEVVYVSNGNGMYPVALNCE